MANEVIFNDSDGRIFFDNLYKVFYVPGVIPPVVVIMASGGQDHSLAIKNNITYAWGRNNEGELGINSTTNYSTPIAVSTTHTFIKVAAGYRHSLGLKADGTVMAWGQNTNGELGNNSTTNQSTPVAVCGVHSFIDIQAGHHSMALKANGELWTWGRNFEAALGDNSTVNKSTPVAVCGAHCFVKIPGNFTFQPIALDNNGQAWMWGGNTFYGGAFSMGDGTMNIRQSTPVAVCQGGSIYTEVAGFVGGGYALDDTGKPYSWGFNHVNQLGKGAPGNECTPIAVYGTHAFAQIQGDNGGGVGLDPTTGLYWSWGYNANGEIGDGTQADKATPINIAQSFSFINSGGLHRLAIKKSDADNFWAWGQNISGEVGKNTSGTNETTPQDVCGI